LACFRSEEVRNVDTERASEAIQLAGTDRPESGFESVDAAGRKTDQPFQQSRVHSACHATSAETDSNSEVDRIGLAPL
jgi:hypothetical protein